MVPEKKWFLVHSILNSYPLHQVCVETQRNSLTSCKIISLSYPIFLLIMLKTVPSWLLISSMWICLFCANIYEFYWQCKNISRYLLREEKKKKSQLLCIFPTERICTIFSFTWQRQAIYPLLTVYRILPGKLYSMICFLCKQRTAASRFCINWRCQLEEIPVVYRKHYYLDIMNMQR